MIIVNEITSSMVECKAGNKITMRRLIRIETIKDVTEMKGGNSLPSRCVISRHGDEKTLTVDDSLDTIIDRINNSLMKNGEIKNE